MKKIIVIVLVILLIALGAFLFFGNGKQTISDFFSDGADFGSFFDAEPRSQNDDIDSGTTPPVNPPPSNTTFVAPVLRQISFEPISGYTFYATTSTSTRVSIQPNGEEVTQEYLATSTVIRFQERATGHIYDVFEFAFAPFKVSNFSVQKIYNAIFSTNRDQFLMQTLIANNEQIRTTFAKIIRSTSTDPILAQADISSVVNDFTYVKQANKMVYSVKQNGVSNIYTANFDKTGEKLLKTISFNEFLMDTVNANEVLITTKASRAIPGYAYILNLTTGAMDKILGNIPGLLAKVSPDKKYYVYTQSEQSRPSTHVYNSTLGTSALLNIDTLAEKCIFSQKTPTDVYCFGSLIYTSAQYPDDWYKGKVFNADALYRISLVDNYVEQVYNFSESGLVFDVINPQLTTGEDFIIFENKYDLTLWSLDLEEINRQVF